MLNNSPQTFNPQNPYVIICEGVDDQSLIKEYLNFLDTECRCINKNEFLILQTNGVDNIAKNMKNYKNYDNYESVKSILFTRDADSNAERATDSLIGNIQDVWKVKLDRNGNFKTGDDGIQIGFYIFPCLDDNQKYKNGTLEDLCAEVLKLPSCILPLVEEHIEKLIDNGIKLKTPHKNRLHICLDSTNNFIGTKIKEAAERKAFNFSHNNFSFLKEKILHMSNF